MSKLTIDYDSLSSAARMLKTNAQNAADAAKSVPEAGSGSADVDEAISSFATIRNRAAKAMSGSLNSYSEAMTAISTLFKNADKDAASKIGELSFGKNEVTAIVAAAATAATVGAIGSSKIASSSSKSSSKSGSTSSKANSSSSKAKVPGGYRFGGAGGAAGVSSSSNSSEAKTSSASSKASSSSSQSNLQDSLKGAGVATSVSSDDTSSHTSSSKSSSTLPGTIDPKRLVTE